MSSQRKKYFIQEHLQEPYLNGGIGYTDVERILMTEKYQPLFFPCHYSFSFFSKLRRLLFLIKLFFTLPTNAIVVFLHPQYATMNKLLVRVLGWRRSIKRVAVIGDINGLRHNNETTLQKELQLFARYDFLILHNQSMLQWMQQQLPGAQCSVLRFFDFLTTPRNQRIQQDNTIAYAGNLLESPFLERLNELLPQNDGIIFKIYGQPYTALMQEQQNIEYMGVSEPYALPAKLEGAYGLIWDGRGVGASEDSIGDYLRYISPHKASLYILSGIPLIVYKEAGIAQSVLDLGIGLRIGSLHELKTTLNSITPEMYAAMSARCRELAVEISTGNGLRAALLEMEKALQ